MIFVLFIPATLYLLAVLWLDTHSLMRRRTLLMAFVGGVLSAGVTYLLFRHSASGNEAWVAWGYPAIEEVIKLVPLLLLSRRGRIAFFADALIYGAAIGIGFSLLENVAYLYLADLAASQMMFRSVATAVLHAGCTSLMAICMVQMFRLRSRRGHWVWYSFLFYLLPVLIHEVYNNVGMLSPNLKFLLLFVLLAALLLWISARNDKIMQQWLDRSVNSNIRLLSAMREGRFFATPQGQLLLQQRENYAPEDFFDLCCYVEVTIELSVIASSRQLLYESGFRQPPTPQQAAHAEALLAEHEALRSRISRVALASIRPIVHLHHAERWLLLRHS